MQTDSYRRLIVNIRATIERSGLKQKVIAERCGLTTNQLSNILCYRKRITVDHLLCICKVLNVTPNDLYFGEVAA